MSMTKSVCPRFRLLKETIDYAYLCGTTVESITNGTETITFGYDGKLITSETLSGTLNQSLGYTYNNDFNLNWLYLCRGYGKLYVR